MRTIPFSQFRQEASRLLDEVQEGEVIVITRNGRPVARVVDVRTEVDQPRWKEPVEPIHPRKGRKAGLSRAVSEGREDRA